MFTLGERFTAFAIAAALLFAAYRIHGVTGTRKPLVTKSIGLILAFLSGLAFLVTFVGGWMADLAEKAAGIAVAGLIVCAVIILVDWILDKKPDKAAFWAAFAFALFLFVGVSQLPQVKDQVGDGGSEITAELERAANGGGK